MRIHRLAVASAALLASTVLIACGSDDNSDSPGNSTNISSPSLTTPGLGSTSGSSMDTTGTTMGSSSDTTLP
jgi:hypothetical protein